MPLTTVTTGQTIAATHVNQLVNVLQKSSGNTEVGKYYLGGWANASSDGIDYYVCSLSRGVAPVSVAIDTADVSPTGVNSPTTAHLTASGFQCFCTATGSGTNIGCSGNYTIQY